MAIFFKVIIGYIWLFDDKIIVSSLVISCTMFEHVLLLLLFLKKKTVILIRTHKHKSSI